MNILFYFNYQLLDLTILRNVIKFKPSACVSNLPVTVRLAGDSAVPAGFVATALYLPVSSTVHLSIVRV